MKRELILITLSILSLFSCHNKHEKETGSTKTNHAMPGNIVNNAFADVNGIKMYYEIYGEGKPLVLIHGGGSTIQSSFEKIIPLLSKEYKIIAVELQNHGRSGHRDVPETFEQDADDVAALLKSLDIPTASFFGFSNGGTTAMLIAIRHPDMVDKLVLAAPAYTRDGFPPGFFEGMQHATIANMPKELKEAFLKVTPDTARLQNMFEKDRDRMIHFKDMEDKELTSIKAPTLLINGDADVITNEHIVKMQRLIAGSRLAIIPGRHGQYIGEITTGDHSHDIHFTAFIIQEFLNNNVQH